MSWNMYKDGKARYDMRIKQQLSVEEVARIIAQESNEEGLLKGYELTKNMNQSI